MIYAGPQCLQIICRVHENANHNLTEQSALGKNLIIITRAIKIHSIIYQTDFPPPLPIKFLLCHNVLSQSNGFHSFTHWWYFKWIQNFMCFKIYRLSQARKVCNVKRTNVQFSVKHLRTRKDQFLVHVTKTAIY